MLFVVSKFTLLEMKIEVFPGKSMKLLLFGAFRCDVRDVL